MIRLLRTTSFFLLLLLKVVSAAAQTADFYATPTSGCAPLVVDFTDNSTGTVTGYSWNLGNSTTSTLQNPSTTYGTPGTYTVTLTVTGPGGSSTKSITIVVYDKPAIVISASPLSACKGQPIQFSSTVTPNSSGTPVYSWDFGDGTTGTGTAPLHTYSTAGTYSVSLTVTNGAGCSNTASQNSYIFIRPSPVPGFTASPTVFCSPPGQSTFYNVSIGGSAPYTTVWDFGDGGSGVGSTVSHTYTTGGSFTVKMVIRDAYGCADSSAIPGLITVVTVPASFTAPAIVCFGVAANFVNNTPDADPGSTTWKFGDGDSATGGQASHLYAAVGTYTVTMTTSIKGCIRTTTRTVTVAPKPVVSITQTPGIPCPPPVTVSWTANSTPAATAYSWRWKSGGTATGQTVSKLYTANLHDSLIMIATTGAGCQDSIMLDTIKIYDLHTDINPNNKFLSGCLPFQPTFNTGLTYWLPLPPSPLKPPQPYPGYVVQATWDFGDGTGSTALTPSHTYSVAGKWQVRCIIITNNGCIDTAYRTVQADTPVPPSFTVSPLTGCPKTPIIFVNTTKTMPDSTYFIWEPGDAKVEIPDTGRFTYIYRDPGNFNPKLYTNHNGCVDSFSLPVTINIKGPNAYFVDSPFCPPSTTAKMFNQSDPATSQLWVFGDGTTDTSLAPIHTFPRQTGFAVNLVVYSSITGCTDTFHRPVDFAPQFFSITASDSAFCRGDSVLFKGIVSGFYSPIRYSWNIDNVQSPYVDDTTGLPYLLIPGLTLNKYLFKTNGYHDVILYITSGPHCFDTLRIPRMVLTSGPYVHISANPPIACLPVSVQFIDSSINSVPGAFRQWSFGDGTTFSDSAATARHTYLQPGEYSVKLIVTDSLGCTDSLNSPNLISASQPKASFTSKDSVCVNAPVLFIPTISGRPPYTYHWDFGDGKTDTVVLPVHSYEHSGLYTVRFILKDSLGCADTAIRSNYLYVNRPVAGYVVSDSIAICQPQQIQFTNTSVGASSYLWDLGTGGPSTVANPVKTYTIPGIYNTTLVAFNRQGCTDTARRKIAVLGNNGAFSYSPIIGCLPLTVQFIPLTPGIPYATWDFSDGVTVTTKGTPVSHTYTTPGAYLPRVIYSDSANCSTISIGLDTIKIDKLTADFTWTTPCAGVAISLNELCKASFSPANSWQWNIGASTTLGATVSYTFQDTGLHSVTLTASNALGCKDTITRDILVHPVPIVLCAGDTTICPADTARLVVSGANSYVWNPAPMVPCSVCDTVFVQPPVTTVYVVTGSDANGCVNKDSATVTIKTKTTSTTGPGGEICIGESFRLHAEGAQSYKWMPAATIDSPFIASPLATPEFTTTYTVIAKEGTCLADSQTVLVTVHPLPLFYAGNDETIALGGAVTLKPTKQGISRIEWRPDTTLGCWNCFDPIAHPFYTRTYYATAYNEFGCSASDSVTVFVRCNGSLVFIPNTFTPNGDGRNDYFFPRGEGIGEMSSFRVFNRWGELIFDRKNVPLNDERAGWDGTYHGKELAPDVYVYTMQSVCSTGEVLNWKGDVTILR
jgi:gliding motility-associated-like protein